MCIECSIGRAFEALWDPPYPGFPASGDLTTDRQLFLVYQLIEIDERFWDLSPSGIADYSLPYKRALLLLLYEEESTIMGVVEGWEYLLASAVPKQRGKMGPEQRAMLEASVGLVRAAIELRRVNAAFRRTVPAGAPQVVACLVAGGCRNGFRAMSRRNRPPTCTKTIVCARLFAALWRATPCRPSATGLAEFPHRPSWRSMRP